MRKKTERFRKVQDQRPSQITAPKKARGQSTFFAIVSEFVQANYEKASSRQVMVTLIAKDHVQTCHISLILLENAVTTSLPFITSAVFDLFLFRFSYFMFYQLNV